MQEYIEEAGGTALCQISKTESGATQEKPLWGCSGGGPPPAPPGPSGGEQSKKHMRFQASPTKEGTSVEEMDGSTSSRGIWLRSSPFSVDKANGKKSA